MQGWMSRKEACFYLGVAENATLDEIKKAYRYKVKLYHPDENPDGKTTDYYIKIQEAYEVLTDIKNVVPNNVIPNMFYDPVNPSLNVRPAKVFSSNAKTKANYKKQKEKQKEVEKLNKWDEEYRENQRYKKNLDLYGEKYASKSKQNKSFEEETLDKIRAIWIAETIKRQIESDKQQKEILQRKKLYEAFMKHELNEDS